MQRGRENLCKNMEQESENLGSTDKDWKCCYTFIVNGFLNIKYKSCRMRTTLILPVYK